MEQSFAPARRGAQKKDQINLPTKVFQVRTVRFLLGDVARFNGYISPRNERLEPAHGRPPNGKGRSSFFQVPEFWF